MSILNLTQHIATPEQVEQGVLDLSGPQHQELVQLLTFEELPDMEEIVARARLIARLAAKAGANRAMVGGAPFLMESLTGALQMLGIETLFAFSKRESVDHVQPDGSVKKVAVFRHAGWIEA